MRKTNQGSMMREKYKREQIKISGKQNKKKLTFFFVLLSWNILEELYPNLSQLYGTRWAKIQDFFSGGLQL